MKVRQFLITILAVMVASVGVVNAQQVHDTGTPDAHDHADHGDHDHHDHGMEGVSLAAFYFTITNGGDETDTLVKVETEIAEFVEIHDVEMDDGVMQMVPMHDGVEIGAGKTIVFEPGSYHVMLIGITESLLDGEDFTATLHFEHAGEVEVTVPIHAIEPDEGEHNDPVDADDIEVSNVWARQAPKLEGLDKGASTPEATPDQD